MVQKYPSCLARIADGRVLQRRGGAGEQRRAGGVPGRRVKEMGGGEGAVGGAGGGGVGGSGGVGGVLDSRVVVWILGRNRGILRRLGLTDVLKQLEPCWFSHIDG